MLDFLWYWSLACKHCWLLLGENVSMGLFQVSQPLLPLPSSYNFSDWSWHFTLSSPRICYQICGLWMNWICLCVFELPKYCKGFQPYWSITADTEARGHCTNDPLVQRYAYGSFCSYWRFHVLFLSAGPINGYIIHIWTECSVYKHFQINGDRSLISGKPLHCLLRLKNKIS